MNGKSLEAPVFFPSASRVKIPFVGDDTRHVKPTTSNLNPIANPLERHQKNVESYMLKQASQCLDFGLDVVKDRCAYTLPYDEDEIAKAYDWSDLIVAAPRPKNFGGRFNARWFRQKAPQQFKILHSPDAAKLKSKIRTVTERHGDLAPSQFDENIKFIENVASEQLRKTSEKTLKIPSPVPPLVGSTQTETARKTVPAHWDECIIDKLSKDTARWIVTENIETGSQRERLEHLLRYKFGPKVSNTALVRDNEKEFDFEEVERRRAENLKKKIKAKKLAEKMNSINKLQEDPVLSQTFAQYYKLPRYLKQKRRLEPRPSTMLNQSAQDIKVKHLEPLPPPKMEDFLNPAAGNYVYATDNAFEQQLYTNQAKPVYQSTGDKTRIIMNDLSEYQCNLQSVYPPSHGEWANENAKSLQVSQKSARPLRGMQRWKTLPNPADFASELGLNLPKCDIEEEAQLKLSQNSFRLFNAPMVNIIEEWRSKWKLAGLWQEITLADVLLDMDSLHAQVRLAAVAVCTVAALHKMPVEEVAVLAVLPKIDSSLLSSNQEDVGHLFKGLLEKVRERLHDSHERVQLAAAMCLYTLNECTDTVMEILKQNLENGIPVDRLACAQCLALKGNTDSKVIKLIIHMLLESDEQTQATALLVHLSQYTRLVHSLLAEQLNSCCWKDKVIACDVLSQLNGNINRDLVHKLSNLMWEDWSSEVRNAAARALGRTGHGRDVHFELRDKLIRGNERVCVDVLRKIAHLGIMTANLLPEFLKCFSSEYVSVRLEAVRTAMKLKIKEEKIVRELLRLTEFDPAWKIKAYAIKALGVIGISSEKIRNALVWALRFENESGVRLEACVAVKKMRFNQIDVLKVLQDRVLVEPDPLVKEEVRKTLNAFGMSGPEDNMEMIQQIKKEVKKLCRKSVVAAKVILYEQELDKFERKAQYIGSVSEDDLSGSGTDDEVDLEISQALSRPKSRGLRSGSALRTPSDAITPQVTISPSTPIPDRAPTSDTIQTRTPSMILEEPELAPSVGFVSQNLSPDVACT